MTPQEKDDLRARIADRLVDMESIFDSRCKLTFVMRSPHLPDGDLIVTSDDIHAVIGALHRLATYPSVGEESKALAPSSQATPPTRVTGLNGVPGPIRAAASSPATGLRNQAQPPPRRVGHDSTDWVDRAAADIRDLNPDYHAFEAAVATTIRAHLAAAPSSSPAPSGRRHEDEEKTATRSPSPDVIPATGSPRTTSPGISHGWQPIETAPKDGTDVIVGGAEGVEVAQWENEHLEQRESGVIVDAGYDAGFWGFSYYGGGPQPMHWMPLPPSPSSQE